MVTPEKIAQVQNAYAKACQHYDATWATHETARAAYRAREIDDATYLVARRAFNDARVAWEIARAPWERLTDRERAQVGLRAPATPAPVQAGLFSAVAS